MLAGSNVGCGGHGVYVGYGVASHGSSHTGVGKQVGCGTGVYVGCTVGHSGAPGQSTHQWISTAGVCDGFGIRVTVAVGVLVGVSTGDCGGVGVPIGDCSVGVATGDVGIGEMGDANVDRLTAT